MIRPTKENQSFILDNGVKVVSKLVPKCTCKGCYFANSYNGCTSKDIHSEEVRCWICDISTGTVLRFIYEKVND